MKIYNSLVRRKTEFEPKVGEPVRMYACGVTPYDKCHLGHAMQAIVFDVIYRYFQRRYPDHKIIYVRNYTDVDDKIINRSKEMGIAPLELSEKMIQLEQESMQNLGIRLPTHSPKVSEYIPQIIVFVQALIDKGAAYKTAAGNVYYRVRSKSDYGKLSGRKVEDMRSGTRVDLEDDKEDPVDFALWKVEDTPGATWPSPFGPGRPGWHIECSVMCHELLGDHIDIHGGGLDLIFPHHENEVAQSESYCGHQHVDFWVHNGLITINKEKMSKSLGNFLTIEDALERFGSELTRYTLLQSHYRSNTDFSPELMVQFAVRLFSLYEHLGKCEEEWAAANFDPSKADHVQVSLNSTNPDELLLKKALEIEIKTNSAFTQKMDDDFNTPEALVVLADAVKFLDEIWKTKKVSNDTKMVAASLVYEAIKENGEVLGLFQIPATQYYQQIKDRYLQKTGIVESSIQDLIKERQEARVAKDFLKADSARNQLLRQGIELRDRPEKTDWMVSKDALIKLYQ